MCIHVYNYARMRVSMKILAVISQKGGVGKTTIATALAVAAESEGRSAAVFDLDPQASASFWHDTREAETPAVVSNSSCPSWSCAESCRRNRLSARDH